MTKLEIDKYYKYIDEDGDWAIFEYLGISSSYGITYIYRTNIIESNCWLLGLTTRLFNSNDLEFIKPSHKHNTPLYKLLNTT